MPNVDFIEDQVVLALAEDNAALQSYAIGFWKPLPSKQPYQEKYYHIQSGEGGTSPLIDRIPQIMDKLMDRIVQKSDFLKVFVARQKSDVT